ncbi:MAG: hypothetical protein ICV78_21160 [Tolypothrix sp. Co-bin9]|nr:hypothetical protein [Tolypothrix sp. Co-bin9]
MTSFRWFPLPRAWVNAIALILLMIAWRYVLGYIWENIGLRINSLINIPWKVSYILLLFSLVSPIFVVAFAHHWSHRLLDNYFPESRLPETETVSGVFPGVMSWWQGLYGWLVSTLSTAIAYTLIALFLPEQAIFYFLKFFIIEATRWQTIPIIIQIIIAACLYQFEYVVYQRLIAAARQ